METRDQKALKAMQREFEEKTACSNEISKAHTKPGGILALQRVAGSRKVISLGRTGFSTISTKTENKERQKLALLRPDERTGLSDTSPGFTPGEPQLTETSYAKLQGSFPASETWVLKQKNPKNKND